MLRNFEAYRIYFKLKKLSWDARLEINTGKYYKAKLENRSPFPLIVWGVGSSYTTDGLGLRHFIQSFEQQDGLHSGMSNGSSTYVPRVPLLTNHSEKALYGVFPLKKCDK